MDHVLNDAQLQVSGAFREVTIIEATPNKGCPHRLTFGIIFDLS